MLHQHSCAEQALLPLGASCRPLLPDELRPGLHRGQVQRALLLPINDGKAGLTTFAARQESLADEGHEVVVWQRLLVALFQ